LNLLASSFFLGVHANIDLLNILVQLVMSMKDILIAKIIPQPKKNDVIFVDTFAKKKIKFK
jgi:hypothetical protein